jgi:hypothetical protein
MNLQQGENQPARSGRNAPMPNGPLKICSATRPRYGQNGWSNRCGWWATPTHLVMAVADGIGHEPKVAEAALTCIGSSLERPLHEIFATLDVQLRDTRGVALAVAVVDTDSWNMNIASVGNIHTVLLKDSGEYPMRNTSGIVGGGYGRLIPETEILSPGAVLALYSDGLDAYFALRETLEIAALSSLDMARTVLDRWARVGEDAAVLICRHETRTIDRTIMLHE